jgi:hydroxymethylglutaryl-CoA lyase
MQDDNRVVFTEVGPRDGFQNWPEPVSTEIKLQLIRAALGAGMPRVEATSFVSPKWVPQMADAEAVVAALTQEEMARIRLLVPNMKGFERAVAAGGHNVLLSIGATDGFNRHNINRSVEETMSDIREVLAAAKPAGVRVDVAVRVVWGCPYDGPVAPERSIALAERLVDAGCAEIAFGDTIGVATPGGVIDVCTQALDRLPGVDIAMHFHDTRGMALANAFAALECGVRRFEGSIGGIGGCPFAPNSTGNVCSEDLLAMIEDGGYETGVDTNKLIDAARALSILLGAELPGRLQRAGRAPWLAPTPA